jgi:outer membrane protein assembly factor BamE (lipoprotein component of BamABCDE complex)
MRWIVRWVPAWTLAVVLSGCATGWFHVGSDFDLNAFTSHVERGVTTRDQVRSWLGAPPSTGVDVDTSGERFDEWTYYFAEGRLASLSDTTLKSLQIKFDSKGIVQGWELSEPPTKAPTK